MSNKAKARVTDVPVFSALESADRRWLRKTARSMSYPIGATIQEAGNIDRRFFVLVDGMVRLDDGIRARDFGPGVAFGDARSSGEELPVTATALSDVRTFVVPSLAMAWLAQHYPHIAVWLQKHPNEVPLAG